jgi:cholesterol oxidase
VLIANDVDDVNDASLLPGYLGCNPLLTVAALAEHNIETILQGRHRRPLA